MEWHWTSARAFSVHPSPTVTMVFSGKKHPSSKTRLPIRTPSSRQTTGLNGVPLKTSTTPSTMNFQKRSCRQKRAS